MSDTDMHSPKDNKITPPSWPLLTESLPGTGGIIKRIPEDFVVEEVPLYTPSGTGTHVYIWIEKTGITTSEAVAMLARVLGRKPRDIGYAGQKDRHAVTRQWLSVEHVTPEAVQAATRPGLQILTTSCHGNKLRLGHLAGNRFAIRIRKLNLDMTEACTRAQAILDSLLRRGVPNYFGTQRFGLRGDNHRLGQAIMQNHRERFIDLFLGHPLDTESPAISRARHLYENGAYEEAHTAWPTDCRDERRILCELQRPLSNPRKAFRVVDKRRKQFFISAYQSYLFNQVVALRLPHIDGLLAGDMAMKHANGACFPVEDVVLEQPRCRRFEISPTGPLMGPRMNALSGPAAAIENSILDPVRPLLEQNTAVARDLGRGGRRALRFLPRDTQVETGQDEHG
ncbi:tRNA pseudouridine(13) synthase TruD, partial [Planctomycetota bacterium]